MLSLCADCARLDRTTREFGGRSLSPTRQCHQCGGAACLHRATPHASTCPAARVDETAPEYRKPAP